jgi:putative exporter of polyketide antibiotics
MNESQKSAKRAVRSAWVSVMEATLVMSLLVEVSVLCLYFGLMSLVILIGPGGLETNQLIALAVHVIPAALSLIAFFGVRYCYFGVITRTSPVKWLLFAMATFGVLALPLASYTGPDDSLVVRMRYLAGRSVLLFINTLAAFYYMDSRTVTMEE